MRILLIGDVGGVDGYHAGDEAMLEAAIGQLRSRGSVALTVVSGDPADTSVRYAVNAVARPGFVGRDDPSDDGRDRRLAAVLALADGADVADELVATGGELGPRALVDAVAAADAVLVTGGGNLSSSWPDQLYDRAAVLLLARRFGVPAVVTGQTIGPDLSERQVALLTQALEGTSLLGLRERASYELASNIVSPSTRRCLQLDDAIFIPEVQPAVVEDGRLGLGNGFVAVTVNSLGAERDAEELLGGVAELVRAAQTLTGLTVVFLPHVGAWGTASIEDVSVGRWLSDRLGEDRQFAVAPLLPARALAFVTRRASAIITTRYHPVVFGMGAAVPCLAIHQDHYTAVKLRGALDHAGLGAWTIPIDALRSGLAADAFGEVWRRRGELTAHLREAGVSWPAWDAAHWDEVWDALRGGRPASSDRRLEPEAMPSSSVVPLQPKIESWAYVNAVGDRLIERVAHAEHRLQAARGDAERQSRSLDALQTSLGAMQTAFDASQAAFAAVRQEADQLRTDLGELDLRRAVIEAEKIQLLDEVRLAELSAKSARSLVAELRRRLGGQDQQLDALYATKTLRWTAAPRRHYSRVRRFFRL